MPRNISAMTFDVFNTLVEPVYPLGFDQKLVEAYSYEHGVSCEEALSALKQALPPKGHHAWRSPTYIVENKARVGESASLLLSELSLRVYPDVEPFLDWAMPRKLGIVARLTPELLGKILETSGLDKYFGNEDYWICSKANDVWKTVPSKLDTDPKRMLHVGDNPTLDLKRPVEHGVCAYLLDRYGMMEPAEWRVESLGELREKLQPKKTAPLLDRKFRELRVKMRRLGKKFGQ